MLETSDVPRDIGLKNVVKDERLKEWTLSLSFNLRVGFKYAAKTFGCFSSICFHELLVVFGNDGLASGAYEQPSCMQAYCILLELPLKILPRI